MSQAELVDTDFLGFFKAAEPDAAAALQREGRIYQELLQYGWSRDDLILAAKTGYGYSAHTAPPYPLKWYDWKSYRDAAALTEWLQHHYRNTKAVEIGMSYDTFVEQWCHFADSIIHRKRRSLEVMRDYVKARRYGLSHTEAERLTWSYADDYYLTYVELRRRKLPRELVTRIVDKYRWSRRERYISISTKYIVEAHRRGANEEELLESVASGTTSELALRLRRAAPAL